MVLWKIKKEWKRKSRMIRLLKKKIRTEGKLMKQEKYKGKKRISCEAN